MFSKLLISKMNVLTRTVTQSTAGQISNTWGTTIADVPTRCSQASKNFTSEDRNYKSTKETYTFYVDASYKDLITKDNRLSFDGKEYYILQVKAYLDDKVSHHIEIHAQIISLGGQSGIQSGYDYSNFVTDSELSYSQAFNGTSVVVTHNLGRFPSVTVVDVYGMEIIGDIDHVNANQLTISFSESVQGTVYCN